MSLLSTTIFTCPLLLYRTLLGSYAFFGEAGSAGFCTALLCDSTDYFAKLSILPTRLGTPRMPPTTPPIALLGFIFGLGSVLL